MIGSQCTTPARLTQSLVLPSPSPSPQHLQPQYFLPLPLISNPQQSSQTSHLERTGATTALGRGHNSILSGQVSSSADSNPPQPQHVLFPNPNPANPPQLAHLRPQRVMFPNPNHANPPQLVQLQPQRATFPNPNPANQPQLVQLQPQRATFPNPNPANQPQLVQLLPQRATFPNPNHANPPQLVQLQPQRATFPNPNPANQPQLQPQNVPFPNPNPGEFLIYLLQFCPAQTSMCFGCGNPLKQQDNNIGTPPSDLVVVSKMLREWTYQGQARSKMGNVYFHCDSNCIKRKEKEFHAHRLSPVNAVLLPHLQLTHRRFLAQKFGV